MFRCDYCGKSFGPKISPIPVVIIRPMTYKVVREVELLGEVEDFTSGYETEKEFKSCSECQKLAGHTVKEGIAQIPVDMEQVKVKVESFHLHARKCKAKERADCFICQRAAEYFSALPANVYNQIMEDVAAVAVHVSMPSMLADAAVNNSLHNTKRDQASAKIALSILGPYAKRVGAIK